MLAKLVAANAAGSAVVWFVGDSIAQLFERDGNPERQRRKFRRALKMAFVGAVSGAEMTVEYHYLALAMPVLGFSGIPAIVAMSTIDVIVLSSVRNSIMLFLVGYGDHFKLADGIQNLRAKFGVAFLITTVLGFPLDLVNFGAIPGAAQVAFTRILDLIVIPPISWFVNRDASTKRRKRKTCTACLRDDTKAHTRKTKSIDFFHQPQSSALSASTSESSRAGGAVPCTDLYAGNEGQGRATAAGPAAGGGSGGAPGVTHTCQRSTRRGRRRRWADGHPVSDPSDISGGTSVHSVDVASTRKERGVRISAPLDTSNNTNGGAWWMLRLRESIPCLLSRKAPKDADFGLMGVLMEKMAQYAACIHAISDHPHSDHDDDGDGQNDDDDDDDDVSDFETGVAIKRPPSSAGWNSSSNDVASDRSLEGRPHRRACGPSLPAFGPHISPKARPRTADSGGGETMPGDLRTPSSDAGTTAGLFDSVESLREGPPVVPNAIPTDPGGSAILTPEVRTTEGRATTATAAVHILMRDGDGERRGLEVANPCPEATPPRPPGGGWLVDTGFLSYRGIVGLHDGCSDGGPIVVGDGYVANADLRESAVCDGAGNVYDQGPWPSSPAAMSPLVYHADHQMEYYPDGLDEASRCSSPPLVGQMSPMTPDQGTRAGWGGANPDAPYGGSMGDRKDSPERTYVHAGSTLFADPAFQTAALTRSLRGDAGAEPEGAIPAIDPRSRFECLHASVGPVGGQVELTP